MDLQANFRPRWGRVLQPGQQTLRDRDMETIKLTLNVSSVYLEDAGGNSDTVLAGGCPVELLHTSITDQWCIQCGEIVTGAHDWHSGDLLLLQDLTTSASHDLLSSIFDWTFVSEQIVGKACTTLTNKVLHSQ